MAAKSSTRTSSIDGSIIRRSRVAASREQSSRTGEKNFVQGFISSSSAALSLPLVDCPDCGQQIGRYVFSSRDNPDRVYYKCENHGGKHGPCNFWYWEEVYHKYLLHHGLLRGEFNKGKIKEEERFNEEEDDIECSKKLIKLADGSSGSTISHV
ncbi:uncharacterized protein LOC107305473 [Oryza brachyantha]|uniref:uncharacterized protein LOC107305473 n=1 Tax=Oryza brachyantha TaxID=4533 RepID=UPI0007768A7A|nr:uncharacterized protein LOC107305473 [Oryza brachyantha]